jgi:hypothetical protein
MGLMGASGGNSTFSAAQQMRHSDSDMKRFSIKNILRGGKLDGFTSEIIENLAAIDHFESLLCTSRSALLNDFGCYILNRSEYARIRPISSLQH